ncbi:MAG: hypothetical protein ABSE90_13445, partial [Verrucomicrobiota bacterium]
PVWVAEQLEGASEKATTLLRQAKSKIHDDQNPEFRRLELDVTIQAGLGKFFAAKFRAGVLYELYRHTDYRETLERAIAANHTARAAWAELAAAAKGIYRDDITFGPEYYQRGHWQDRLAALDEDITDMEKFRMNRIQSISVAMMEEEWQAIELASGATRMTSKHPSLADFHIPPTSFRRGQPLSIAVHAPKVAGVRLRYRRVNQAEDWRMLEMAHSGKDFCAEIPASYTDSPFPLQYHFQIHANDGGVRLHPGLNPGWNGQPYFVVRQA